MKIIIISAINLIEGGTLSILQDCLKYLSDEVSNDYEIIALVNNKKLAFYPKINYIEFPKSKKSWLLRLYYEYIYFKKLSKKIKPYLWFSLHDITPNVFTERLAVYCHNPSPFYHLSLKDIFFDPKFALFNLFYKYLYILNIKKNSFVIVQQRWLREEFNKLYENLNIIVASPNINRSIYSSVKFKKDKIHFFYPSFPRVFKNFELICEAAKILENEGLYNFEIILTIDGAESRYSKHIYKKYNNIKSLKFIGLQTREKVFELYERVDCLIFPSKLETWGLPLTEFKTFNKSILVADLSYAHETVGEYEKVKFFNPESAEELAKYMKNFIENKLIYDKITNVQNQSPFTRNWDELFKILLSNKE